MDPKIYDQRAKFKSLPLDFQHQDVVNYESNYDYCKTLSTYHFDKWKIEQEGEWYSKLGRFENIESRFAEFLPRLEEEAKKVGWNELSTAGVHPGFLGGKSPAVKQEEYDRLAHGGGEFTQVVPEPKLLDIPVLMELADYWKMKRARIRVHVQLPGQMFPMHIDKLQHRYPADPGKVIRLVVNMQDYEPGQLMVYGNSVFTQWKAGDVHCFDTGNIPHSTANMSRIPRAIFVLTGVRTEETDAILASSNSSTIHRL